MAKQLSPEVLTVMKAAIPCINLRKANAKQECLFKDVCSQMDDAHVQLLLHTEVRWLSKGNWLDRLVELYDTFRAATCLWSAVARCKILVGQISTQVAKK